MITEITIEELPGIINSINRKFKEEGRDLYRVDVHSDDFIRIGSADLKNTTSIAKKIVSKIEIDKHDVKIVTEGSCQLVINRNSHNIITVILS